MRCAESNDNNRSVSNNTHTAVTMIAHLPLVVLATVLSSVTQVQGQNPIFPLSTNRTTIPDCSTCLNDIVSNTCRGPDDSGFSDCMCLGEGATEFENECYATCCNLRAITCAGNPWREWWLSCVDDYPSPFCAKPPNRLSPEYKEHCTQEEMDAAHESTEARGPPSAVDTDPSPEPCAGDSLSNFNRDGDDCVPESAATKLGISPLWALVPEMALFLHAMLG